MEFNFAFRLYAKLKYFFSFGIDEESTGGYWMQNSVAEFDCLAKYR